MPNRAPLNVEYNKGCSMLLYYLGLLFLIITLRGFMVLKMVRT